MNRIIKIYLALAVMACSMSSCLEKYPDDAILADKAINTVQDMNQFMIGVYASFKSPSLYSGALTLLPDLQADLAYGVEGNSNVYGDIWRWDFQANNTNITSVYGSLYEIIANCNFMLDHAGKVRENTFDDQALDDLDIICGEATFARALAYSELVKLFCKPYEGPDEASKELGVVLVDHYYDNPQPVRSTLKDSYDFILKDLTEAARLLKLDDDYSQQSDGPLYNTIYFNEYTVHALRARVALYMKDYDEAIKYAGKVIDSRYYMLSSVNQTMPSGQNYYDYMWTSDNSSEVIWKVDFTINSPGGSLGQIFFNWDYMTVKPDYVPAQWVIQLFEGNDKRLEYCFGPKMKTGYAHGLEWWLVRKYWGNQEFAQVGINQTSMPKVFRLAEQYLIRAEALAMKGDYSNARKDIAALRAARYSNFGGGVAMNKDNAMEVIENERVKELYMEGFRLMDLKRWHKGFERHEQPNTHRNGNHLKVRKDHPFFVWPIPRHELEAPGSQIQGNESNN